MQFKIKSFKVWARISPKLLGLESRLVHRSKEKRLENISGVFHLGSSGHRFWPDPGSIFGMPHEVPLLLVRMVLQSCLIRTMCHTCLCDEQFWRYWGLKLKVLHLIECKCHLNLCYKQTLFFDRLYLRSFLIDFDGRDIGQLLKDFSFRKVLFCQNRSTHAEVSQL